MHIIFGWSLDGNCYPATSGQQLAGIGQPVVGPKGLIEILESQLGLSRRVPQPAVRIARYQSRLHQLLELSKADGRKPLFYESSFQLDSWETSRRLLRWRDELSDNGWDGRHIDGPRLGILAQLESMKDTVTGRKLAPIGYCTGERLRDIQQELADLESNVGVLEIAKIERIFEPNELVPDLWSELFDLLARCGVEIQDTPSSWRNRDHVHSDSAQHDANNLAVIQRALLDVSENSKCELRRNDNSFILIETRQERQATDLLVSYLEHIIKNNSNSITDGNCTTVGKIDTENTVIIYPNPCRSFEEALEQANLPIPSPVKISRAREILQLLPLALEMLWEPPALERVIEFLKLPLSPIPQNRSEEFVHELICERQSYEKSWTEILQSHLAKYSCSTDDWRYLLQPEQRFKYDEGLPIDVIRKVCQYLEKWAFNRMNELYYIDNQEHIGVISERHYEAICDQLKIFQEVLASLESSICKSGFCSRVLLGRVLHDVSCDETITGEDQFHPVSADSLTSGDPRSFVSIVDSPGRIWAPAARIICWGGWQRESVASLSRFPWSPDERDSLSRNGVRMPELDAGRLRQLGRDWRQALCKARSQFLIVLSRRVQDEPPQLGGIWPELRSKCKELEQICCYDAQRLYDLQQLGKHVLDGVVIEPRVRGDVPQPRALWQPGSGRLQRRLTESSSSVKTLLKCPLAWSLKYIAELEPGELSRMDSNEIQEGNLAHAVCCEVLSSCGHFDHFNPESIPEICTKQARIVAPDLIAKHPWRFGWIQRLVTQAIDALVQMIRRSRLRVVSCEQELWARLPDGQKIQGRLDLVLEDNLGQSVVIDLKWSRSEGKYREEIKGGYSVQLAFYNRLLQTNGRLPVSAGFFLARQRKMLCNRADLLPGAGQIAGNDLQQVWNDIYERYQQRMSELEAGSIRVRGISLAGELTAPIDEKLRPDCGFCHYRPLCGADKSGD